MTQLRVGQQRHGYVVDALLHGGAMADLYRVHAADGGAQPEFPLLLKLPRLRAGEGGENLVGFESERQLLADLHGPHVPRFVAAGDIAAPYLVMEYIAGETLQQWLDRRAPRDIGEIARLGARVAQALHA